ncbi:hypothetical protein Tco_0910682 [Tanacetum coccineum]|uniref:Uncharacterized protein n=1 Tax=Tanacetum coccineum TaxID=301880 RepID=A0ABQ5CW72_9ASTR
MTPPTFSLGLTPEESEPTEREKEKQVEKRAKGLSPLESEQKPKDKEEKAVQRAKRPSRFLTKDMFKWKKANGKYDEEKQFEAFSKTIKSDDNIKYLILFSGKIPPKLHVNVSQTLENEIFSTVFVVLRNHAGSRRRYSHLGAIPSIVTRKPGNHGVVKPEIEGNVNFEIKSQFMRELREDTFFRNKDEDAHDHIDRQFTIEIKDKKGTENLAVDYLSGLENPDLEELNKDNIQDNFPDEHLMVIKLKNTKTDPWYADYANFLVTNIVP